MIPAMIMVTSRILLTSIFIGMSTVAADSGRSGAPVFELLAARTAQIESESGVRVIYHHRDGRMAMTASPATEPVFGQWWIDGNGDYCLHPDDESTEACYRASMNGAQLQLFSTSSSSALLVQSLAPGDIHGLLGDSDLEEAACDCRLTARRRGARNVE